MTFDEANISNASFECEEVRGICETFKENSTHMKTPVNVRLLSNDENKLSTPRPTSAMNVSDFNDSDMELTQVNLNLIQMTKQNENNDDRNSISKTVQQILKDFECDSPTDNDKEQNFKVNTKECDKNSNDDVENVNPKILRTTKSSSNRDIIVMHSKPVYSCQHNSIWPTPGIFLF